MHSVEPFREEHIDPALSLWQRTEHVGVSVGDEPASIAGFLARNAGLSFVALDSGQVIGAVLCGHDGRRGYVYHLAVEEGHRRKGVGGELLASCLDALRGAGIEKCHAFVFHKNPFGEMFWRREGWESREDLLIYSRHPDSTGRRRE